MPTHDLSVLLQRTFSSITQLKTLQIALARSQESKATVGSNRLTLFSCSTREFHFTTWCTEHLNASFGHPCRTIHGDFVRIGDAESLKLAAYASESYKFPNSTKVCDFWVL